jgi:hypothetical protein
LDRLKEKIVISDYQFGFREKHSTDICSGVLKDVVSHYQLNNSYVFLTFLDMSKAFDYVNYWRMFSRLINDGVDMYLVRLLVEWYSGEKMCVHWNGVNSECFSRNNGVRQGSPLSPFLFSYYVDNMIRGISKYGKGCKYRGVWINVLAYADDIVLLSPSWSAMQELLDCIEGLAEEIDMVFNVQKTKSMIIKPVDRRKRFLDSIPVFKLNDRSIEFCIEFKYLGHIVNNLFNDSNDLKRELKLLYIRTNKLIGRFWFCSNDVKRSLWCSYANSLYGAGLWKLSSHDRKMYVVACNKCIKKFFGVSKFVRNRLFYMEVDIITPSTILHNSVCAYEKGVSVCSSVNSVVRACYMARAIVF